MGSPKKHGDVSHGESGDNCRTCDLAIGGIANCELFGERDKRRLTRFVLASQNLVNSQIIQNIAAQDAHWYVSNVRA